MKYEYEVIEDIKCYAPKLAYSNNDYNEDSFDELFNCEDNNFQFRSRNRVIQNLFSKHAPRKKGSFLEIGCGTGYVLKGLNNSFPSLKLSGAEIYLKGLE